MAFFLFELPDPSVESSETVQGGDEGDDPTLQDLQWSLLRPGLACISVNYCFLHFYAGLLCLSATQVVSAAEQCVAALLITAMMKLF
jgi:hypothetical protein